MKRRLSRDFRRPLLPPWGWIVTLGCLIAALAIYVAGVGAYTEGHYTYALDDAYIHLAIARNLVESGVWGTSPHEFGSASSSIIWPLAIALTYLVAGVNEWSPFVLNGAALVWGAWAIRGIVIRELPKLGCPSVVALLLFLASAMAAPVTSLLLTGLEHIWHWIAVLVAVDRAAQAISCEAEGDARASVERRALFWAPWLTLVRFESMALVPVLVALAVLRGRWRFALGYGLAGVAPVLIFGLWSLSRGGMFFPNSLVIKASPDGEGAMGKLVGGLMDAKAAFGQHPQFLALVLAAVGLWCLSGSRRWRSVPSLTLCAFVTMAIAHAAFADFGWLYRYEAYLYAWGVFACLLGLLAWLQDIGVRVWWTRAADGARVLRLRAGDVRLVARQGWNLVFAIGTAFALCVAGWGMIWRTEQATLRARRATGNIYEQQYQVARFLGRYYRDEAVALNDIGAAGFFPGVDVVDLYGLGSTEVARLKRSGSYSVADMDRITRKRDVRIAVVYDRWFRPYGGLPSDWLLVGKWSIRDNVVCGDEEVSFYAVNRAEADRLARCLNEFEPELPARVIRNTESTGGLEGPGGGG